MIFTQKCKSFFDSIYLVDPRSYRLFCSLLGLLTLWDVYSRFLEAKVFYSCSGVLTDEFIKLIYGNTFDWSINLLSRTTIFQQTLLLFQAVVSVALLSGQFGRLVIVILWILVASRQVANPYVLSAGDELLRHLLFWSCFLDTPRKDSNRLNIGGVALAVQLLLVYFFTAVMKTSPAWRSEGTAISMALSLESFIWPHSKVLLNYPALLRFLTIATWYLELLIPVAFILSGAFKFARLGLVLLMIGFHLGLAATFRLGYFPFVCIAGWCLWLPEIFWKFFGVRDSTATDLTSLSHRNKTFETAKAFLCMYLLLFTLAINYRTSQVQKFYLNPNLNKLGTFFQLWQQWGMFAPMPSIDDGWNSFDANLVYGGKVRLNARGGPEDGTILRNLSSDRPENLGAAYRTIGWRTILYSLHQGETSRDMVESYLEYLCKRTMKQNPQFNVESIDFSYNVEWTLPDLTKSPPENVFILNHRCAHR